MTRKWGLRWVFYAPAKKKKIGWAVGENVKKIMEERKIEEASKNE